MMTRHNVIMRVLLLLAMSFLVSACQGSSDDPATYERLCQIYQEVVPQPVSLRMKEVTLVKRVQKELPGFFNENFTHIATANADQRYGFTKRLAKEAAGKSDWSCEVMKAYYENEFNKSKQGSIDDPATYERLCQIYQEVVPQPIALAMKEANIVKRVQKELPGFFNDNFFDISREYAGNRYADIKWLAKDEAGKSDWSCEVMKAYFENEFSKPAKD